jgi:hypothetical protein
MDCSPNKENADEKFYLQEGTSFWTSLLVECDCFSLMPQIQEAGMPARTVSAARYGIILLIINKSENTTCRAGIV